MFLNTPRKDTGHRPLGVEIKASEIRTADATVNYLKFTEVPIGATE